MMHRVFLASPAYTGFAQLLNRVKLMAEAGALAAAFYIMHVWSRRQWSFCSTSDGAPIPPSAHFTCNAWQVRGRNSIIHTACTHLATLAAPIARPLALEVWSMMMAQMEAGSSAALCGAVAGRGVCRPPPGRALLIVMMCYTCLSSRTSTMLRQSGIKPHSRLRPKSELLQDNMLPLSGCSDGFAISSAFVSTPSMPRTTSAWLPIKLQSDSLQLHSARVHAVE